MNDLRLSFVAEQEVSEERAQWWDPALKVRWAATDASSVNGAEAANFTSIAEECNRVLGREPAGAEGKLDGGLVSAAKARELSASNKSKAFRPLEGRPPPKSIADTRLAITWKRWMAKRMWRLDWPPKASRTRIWRATEWTPPGV